MPPETDKHSDVVKSPSSEAGVAAALHRDAYAPQAVQNGARPVIADKTDNAKADPLPPHVDFGDGPDLYGRTKLLADARANIKDADQEYQFELDLKDAETRARKENLSVDQMSHTYNSIDALLTSDNNRPTAASDRVILAEQVMDHVAHPDAVGQGNYGTCGAATMEVETYRYHPDAAAEMISSIALKGHFDTKNGTEVAVDPQPIGESVDPKTHETVVRNFNYQRDYASQLFQVGAMDVGIESRTRGDEASRSKDLHYVEDPMGGAAVFTDDSGQVQRRPNYGLMPQELATAYESITGDKNITVISKTQVDAVKSNPLLPAFESEAKLDSELASAKSPVIARVNADAPGFDESDTSGKDKAGRPIFLDDADSGHFVVIEKYIPATATSGSKVEVFNTQGGDNAFGDKGEVSVHDLYLASIPRQEAISVLKNDLEADRASGKKEPIKELELLRLNYEEGSITKTEARRERDRIQTEMSKTYEGMTAFDNNYALRMDLDNILYEPAPAATPRHKAIKKR